MVVSALHPAPALFSAGTGDFDSISTRGNDESTLKLISFIYEAVSEGSRWPVFLETFVRAIEGAEAR